MQLCCLRRTCLPMCLVRSPICASEECHRHGRGTDLSPRPSSRFPYAIRTMHAGLLSIHYRLSLHIELVQIGESARLVLPDSITVLWTSPPSRPTPAPSPRPIPRLLSSKACFTHVMSSSAGSGGGLAVVFLGGFAGGVATLGGSLDLRRL